MEILIIFLLLAINGLFAMAEIAFVSSRKSSLHEMAKRGVKGAIIAIEQLREPEKFLSTVQVGISLVGVFAGAYGGIEFASKLSPFFEQFSFLKEYAFEIAFTVIVAMITYLSLVVGELLPKTIALNNPERITVYLAPLMKILAVIASPIIFFLSLSTKALMTLLRVKPNSTPPVSEQELKSLIEQGRQYGILEKKESEIMHSVFKLTDRSARQVMTPRHNIVWIDLSQDSTEVAGILLDNGFTKYPVCEGSLDKLIGILNVRDYLNRHLSGAAIDLKNMLVHPVYVPENATALTILEKFKETKTYIAVIVDEYGSTEGLVTLHDLVETILGELPDITDFDSPGIVKRADGSMLIDGSMRIDDLSGELNPNPFLEIRQDDFSTLGGFVMFTLRKIPKTGEVIRFNGYQIEVADMDGKRVDKLIVSKTN